MLIFEWLSVPRLVPASKAGELCCGAMVFDALLLRSVHHARGGVDQLFPLASVLTNVAEMGGLALSCLALGIVSIGSEVIIPECVVALETEIVGRAFCELADVGRGVIRTGERVRLS